MAATIFGLATSLCLGAQQAMAGVSFLYGIARSPATVLALIAFMAEIAFLSLGGGIDRGIRILSQVDMWVVFALLVFVLRTASTIHLIRDASIAQIVAGNGAELAEASLDPQLFVLLSSLPWAAFTSVVAIALILIFCVTGWDSGKLVIDTMMAGGRTDTPLRQKTVWLFTAGGIGVALLLSDGLKSLQAGALLLACRSHLSCC